MSVWDSVTNILVLSFSLELETCLSWCEINKNPSDSSGRILWQQTLPCCHLGGNTAADWHLLALVTRMTILQFGIMIVVAVQYCDCYSRILKLKIYYVLYLIFHQPWVYLMYCIYLYCWGMWRVMSQTCFVPAAAAVGIVFSQSALLDIRMHPYHDDKSDIGWKIASCLRECPRARSYIWPFILCHVMMQTV